MLLLLLASLLLCAACIFRSVSPDWLQSVFGVASYEYLHPEAAAQSLGCTDTPLGLRTLAVIRELRLQRLQPDYMQLKILRQGDSSEQLCVSLLISLSFAPLSWSPIAPLCLLLHFSVSVCLLSPVSPLLYFRPLLSLSLSLSLSLCLRLLVVGVVCHRLCSLSRMRSSR